MNVEKHLKGFRSTVEKKLSSILSKASPLKEAMRYSVLGSGKRLRAILLIESCKICGGRINNALAAAAALELIHAYSLVHDDLPSMDNDDFRRGKPSCHKKFTEADAILAGDALIPLAFNMIAKGLKGQASTKAIVELSEAIGSGGMAAGQAMDLKCNHGNVTKQHIDKINLLKTARLFEASCKIGAIAADAAKKDINNLGRFGRLFGLSYQIYDDILDNGSYVRYSDVEKARIDARALIIRAKAALSSFGRRADTLKAITDRILRI